MKTSIKNLIAENPSGLLEMKPSLSVSEYMDNYGFRLEKILTIYESGRSHMSRKDWFAFPKSSTSLETLFKVQEESEGDLLVVFIVETVKAGRIYCHLVLNDEAFREILNDNTQYVFKVHQMYTKYFKDHIAINMTTC